MKAKLIHNGKTFRGYIENEAVYNKLKSGDISFKRPERISHYVVPKEVFERLLKLDNLEPWISIKDKLPEKNERVLCIFREPDGACVVCENTYKGDGEWFDDATSVTHWMTMPNMPEVES